MKTSVLLSLFYSLLLLMVASIPATADIYNYDAAGRLTRIVYADASSITYTYDANGNILTQVTAAAGTTDIVPPVITMLGTSPVTSAHGAAYVDAGATAADNKDGDITANIVIANTVDIYTVGAYTVTYNVNDAGGNPAVEVSRTVNITDQTAPVITLLGANPLNHAQGTVFVDPGTTVSDNVDIGLTAAVTGTVTTAIAGDYLLTYTVSDGVGNAATPVNRTVHVADMIAPTISLVGNSVVTTLLGAPYIDAGATANDDIEGDISVNISTVNPVDIYTAGSYVVTYNVSDATGNAAAQVSRTVNVTTDIVPPVITLLGSANVSVAQDAAYNDAGAAASDNVDGNITANIVKAGTFIDTSTAGSFTITYDVSDNAGNAATQVVRTITVTAAAGNNSGIPSDSNTSDEPAASSGGGGCVTPVQGSQLLVLMPMFGLLWLGIGMGRRKYPSNL